MSTDGDDPYPRELRVGSGDEARVMVRRDDDLAVGLVEGSEVSAVDGLVEGVRLEEVEVAPGVPGGDDWLRWVRVADGSPPAGVAAAIALREDVWLVAPVYVPEGAEGGVGAAAPLLDTLVAIPREGRRDEVAALLEADGLVLDDAWSAVMGSPVRAVAVDPAPPGAALRALDVLRGREDLVVAADLDWLAMDPLQYDPSAQVARWADQWNLRAIGMPDAWDVTWGARRVVVAVVDSGVDLDHPALEGAMAPADLHARIGLVGGRIVVTGDAGVPPHPPPPPAPDRRGHGTAVAGIVAAALDGASQVAGMAPGCRLMPIRVSPMVDSAVAAAIVIAADRGARVVNLSIATGTPHPSVEYALAVAGARNVVVCAAAGNGPADAPGIAYPARHPGVLGVGAFAPDGDRKRSGTGEAWFSREGAGLDVLAPGLGIPTTDVWGDGGYNVGDSGRGIDWYGRAYSDDETGDEDGHYLWVFTGTSAATAHVSALAALIVARCPGLTGEEVRTLITQTCDDIASAIGDDRVTTGPDDAAGWGRINAARALSAAAGSERCGQMTDETERGRPRRGLPEDDPMEQLVPDPCDVPDVIVLSGWRGRSRREGWTRLYLTPAFDDYVEFPAAGVHAQEVFADPGAGPPVRVWLACGSHLRRVRSSWSIAGLGRPGAAPAGRDFLGGSITDGATWTGGGAGGSPWDTEPTACPACPKSR